MGGSCLFRLRRFEFELVMGHKIIVFSQLSGAVNGFNIQKKLFLCDTCGVQKG